MGYLGRRIGLSQDKGDSTPGGADGAVGGGILDLFASGYFQREGNIYNAPGIIPSGLTATGGVISDYVDGPTVYRAHIFTSSGTFDVTEPGTFGDTVEYLVVAGGGSGGYEGGAGAGGLRTNLSGHPLSTGNPSFTASVSTYPIVIGAGGAGGAAGPSLSPNSGNPSYIGPAGSKLVESTGGGGAGNYPATPGRNGGSGGGASSTPNTLGYGRNPSTPGPAGGPFAWTEGNPGSNSQASNPYWGGAGGGAGASGGEGTGGAGVQVAIAGPAADTTGVGALNPGPGEYQWFAGGGAGGRYPTGSYSGGVGGGGSGSLTSATSGTYSTGGGGGGVWSASPPGSNITGSGGSGIVVVRYQIAQLTATAKATGGAISFYGGKTIHTFTGSGTFATTSDWSAATVEYVVIGGGGGGGNSEATTSGGGGGGAGAYRTGTTPIGAHPVSTSIQVGAGGRGGLAGGIAPGKGVTGTSSYFGTPITSPGGGGGGNGQTPGEGGGLPGGSGGGGGYAGTQSGASGTGDPFPGTIGSTPTNGWGGDGPSGGGSGGGGAGGNGSPRSHGGAGIQLPSTFRNPVSTVGAPGPTSAPIPNGFDTSGKYWVAGGGAGGHLDTNKGGGSGGPYAGAGDAPEPGPGGNALANTGSGGGGDHAPGSASQDGGHGGAGIVIIAYPT